MAIGHDLIEDCSGKTIIYKGVPMVISYSMLREVGMSERVIDGIRCGTKVPGETYAEYKEKCSRIETLCFGNDATYAIIPIFVD